MQSSDWSQKSITTENVKSKVKPFKEDNRAVLRSHNNSNTVHFNTKKLSKSFKFKNINPCSDKSIHHISASPDGGSNLASSFEKARIKNILPSQATFNEKIPIQNRQLTNDKG